MQISAQKNARWTLTEGKSESAMDGPTERLTGDGARDTCVSNDSLVWIMMDDNKMGGLESFLHWRISRPLLQLN